MAGKLYIVGTPIGNMGDITLRAIEVLRAVDVIACEDTRTTSNLLQRHAIENRLIAHHSHNQRNSAKGIIALLEEGKEVALVSDSGMPVISDPGGLLIAEATSAGFEIDVIPGPTALTTAAALAGLSAPYIFGGFSPAKTGNLRKRLATWLATDMPVILYESPHRATRLMDMLTQEFGDPEVTVARELTKIHQKLICAHASEIKKDHTPAITRGELVIIVHPQNSK